MPMYTPLFIIAFIVIFLLANWIKVLKEYERGVIFRLGRVIKAKGPGLIILIPVVDKMVKVSLRLLVLEFQPWSGPQKTLAASTLAGAFVISGAFLLNAI